MKGKILIFVLLFVWVSSIAQIKVACVGNSITLGFGAGATDSLSYPQQLGKILGNSWIVKNFGVGGTTMLKKGDKPYWAEPQFKQAIDFMPDVVIIKLGTNGPRPQNWLKYKDEFEKDYSDMIETFQNLKSHPKIWLGIPVPVAVAKWGINKNIVEKDIPPVLKRLAHKYKLGLIDFYSCLSEKYELLPDGIHPNAGGYKLMAETAAKVLNKNKKKILKR